MTGSHHSLQLWVNLPAADKNDRAALPGSRRRCYSCAARTGVEVGIYSGASGGVTAPTKNFVPVTMVEIRLDLGASVARIFRYNAVIVVLEGEAIGAEGKSVTAGDVAGLTRGDNRKVSESELRPDVQYRPRCS